MEIAAAVSSHHIFKFSEDSPKISEGHTNVSEHFRLLGRLTCLAEDLRDPFTGFRPNIGNFVKISSQYPHM